LARERQLKATVATTNGVGKGNALNEVDLGVAMGGELSLFGQKGNIAH